VELWKKRIGTRKREERNKKEKQHEQQLEKIILL
jgi:hypothetical protein